MKISKYKKHKYDIRKYIVFMSPKSHEIEQKVIISKAYTRIDLAIKLFISMFLYDDVDYKTV